MPRGTIGYMPSPQHQSTFWQISMHLDHESAAGKSGMLSTLCSLRGSQEFLSFGKNCHFELL
ncbi:MAG: hypothetical protein ACJAWV_004041 [Flammeovirgaceae bacterium]|jgi:hypothetical protein